MKYCLNSKCSMAVLKRADEVRVFAEDEGVLMDWIERMPDKTIILELPKDKEPDLKMYMVYKEKFADFIVRTSQLDLCPYFIENDIKWCWAYPVNTYQELQLLVALRPARIEVTAPLSFDLPQVKSIVGNISLTMYPHKAQISYLPLKVDGRRMQWVRPEDAELYSQWVDSFDFSMEEPRQAETYLHIYKENGCWPGNLNLLITGLNVDIDNRSISSELAEARVKCGQRCLRTGACHKCDTEFAKCKLIKDIHNGKIKVNS